MLVDRESASATPTVGGHTRMNATVARRVLSVSFALISLVGVMSIGGCGGGDAEPNAWIEDGIPAAEK